jgi:hypothetical protein
MVSFLYDYYISGLYPSSNIRDRKYRFGNVDVFPFSKRVPSFGM